MFLPHQRGLNCNLPPLLHGYSPWKILLQSLCFETDAWKVGTQEAGCLTKCRITQHTLKQNDTLPQNSRRWPLCTSANTGIAAGCTAETCWQEGPIQFLLWQSWPLQSNEIYTQVGVLSCGERDKNQLSVKSGEYGGCGKTVTSCLASSLGQEQSDVQGHCHVATSISSYAKAQDAYDKLNSISNQGSPCSRFCL